MSTDPPDRGKVPRKGLTLRRVVPYTRVSSVVGFMVVDFLPSDNTRVPAAVVVCLPASHIWSRVWLDVVPHAAGLNRQVEIEKPQPPWPYR